MHIYVLLPTLVHTSLDVYFRNCRIHKLLSQNEKASKNERRESERDLCDWNALEWNETPCAIQANLFTAGGMKYAEKQVQNRTNNELKLDYKSLKMKFSVCCWYFVGNIVGSVAFWPQPSNKRETMKWFDTFFFSPFCFSLSLQWISSNSRKIKVTMKVIWINRQNRVQSTFTKIIQWNPIEWIRNKTDHIILPDNITDSIFQRIVPSFDPVGWHEVP